MSLVRKGWRVVAITALLSPLASAVGWLNADEATRYQAVEPTTDLGPVALAWLGEGGQCVGCP